MINNINTAYEETFEDNQISSVRIHKLYFPAGTKNLFYIHWHREYEFFYVTKGAALFTVETREYIVYQGEGIFVNSNFTHEAKGYENIECEFVAVVFFDSFLVDKYNRDLYGRFIYPIVKKQIQFAEVYTPTVKWQHEVLDLLKSIDKLGTDTADKLREYELLLKSRVLEIWHKCFYNPMLEQVHDNNDKLERMSPVINYIDKNYMYHISLDSLAKLIPMSEGQFCRAFKELLGMSPMNYVVRKRILQSCDLLLHTDKKITEIAILTGFNNISYFNKTFLLNVGCTPSIYRKHK